MSKIKVLLITERRADYSRIKPILNELSNSDLFNYDLIVTGMHLLKEHGYTIQEILNDGFRIAKTFEMFQNSNNNPSHMVEALGVALKQLPKMVLDINPSLIITGFDIAANFALTITGAHLNIPVAHVQGGEVSGTIDESIRHAMSKFAHIHFAGNEDARQRLIKLGEIPELVFDVGCPSIDALLQEDDRPQVLTDYGLDSSFFLVLQHPVTTEFNDSRNQIVQTLKALDEFDVDTLFILPNNDSGSSNIIRTIKESGHKYTESLSINNYVNLLKRCEVLIGNSSSGIHESHVFGIPTVNIGSRQNGRLQSDNVINCDYNSVEIKEAIQEAIGLKGRTFNMPYGKGDSGQKILKILTDLNLELIKIQKKITY
jgi:GDP/UDP-N,N'-diacetylbacillosamine 2-epimerase (hydrolysing)